MTTTTLTEHQAQQAAWLLARLLQGGHLDYQEPLAPTTPGADGDPHTGFPPSLRGIDHHGTFDLDDEEDEVVRALLHHQL